MEHRHKLRSRSARFYWRGHHDPRTRRPSVPQSHAASHTGATARPARDATVRLLVCSDEYAFVSTRTDVWLSEANPESEGPEWGSRFMCATELSRKSKNVHLLIQYPGQVKTSTHLAGHGNTRQASATRAIRHKKHLAAALSVPVGSIRALD